MTNAFFVANSTALRKTRILAIRKCFAVQIDLFGGVSVPGASYLTPTWSAIW
jgi:hypothetical protein